jgi:hypothetical protein
MALAIFENKALQLTWIDVTSPSETELSELSAHYGLNAYAYRLASKLITFPNTKILRARISSSRGFSSLFGRGNLFLFNPSRLKLPFFTGRDYWLAFTASRMTLYRT